jgi:DNA-binding response OmpR family regulator
VTEANHSHDTVLVVEDERQLADLYGELLADTYEVRTAYGGEEAIGMLSPDVDVVLLDRKMPLVSGREVLTAIEEGGYDCRVAMVTAVEPDLDIVSLHIDDYVVKPISMSTVREVVERLVTLSDCPERLRELTAKKRKRDLLQGEKQRPELDASTQFGRLEAEIEELKATLGDPSIDLPERRTTPGR